MPLCRDRAAGRGSREEDARMDDQERASGLTKAALSSCVVLVLLRGGRNATPTREVAITRAG